MNLIRQTALAFTLLTGASLYAAGGNSGGGGLIVELDVASVRSYLFDNCSRFETFKRHKIDCGQFRAKMDEVGGLGGNLTIEDGPLLLDDGRAVDAKNYQPGKIEISRDGWKNAGGDTALKIGIKAHEYLSLMGLERTGDYSISKNLVNELRSAGAFKAADRSGSNILEWFRSQFEGRPNEVVQFRGVNLKTGQDCLLYLTDISGPPAYEDYFVVVAPAQTGSADDYIGMGVSQAAGARADSDLSLNSEHSWGNQSRFNCLRITVNLFGEPIAAEGRSDLRRLRCSRLSKVPKN